MIAQLKGYHSKEEKKSIYEDTNLVGYLSLITELFNHNPKALKDREFSHLIEEIINKCLFTFEPKYLNENITKTVDIR